MKRGHRLGFGADELVAETQRSGPESRPSLPSSSQVARGAERATTQRTYSHNHNEPAY